MALAVAAAVVVSTTLLSLTIEGANGGSAGRRPVGAIDPSAFRDITPGTLALTVRSRLGRPHARRRPPLRLGGLDCWTYTDASGSGGRFRFCFRRGSLVSKARIRPPAPSAGDGGRTVSAP